MMTKKIYFLLAFLLTMIGGGKLWAENYIPSGTAKSFTATTDIIVASTDGSTANSVIDAGKTANWIKIPSESYSSKTPASDSEIDTPTSNVYCLQVKSDGGTFKENKRVIHFKVTGITGVKAIGQANSGRGFQIGATEYVEGTTDENTPVYVVAGSSSAVNPVSYSGLDKSKTYIISIFAYSSDTYLYAVRFISDPYETSIGIGDLCYAVGTTGKSASSNGLDRAVGGFNLTFGGGEGIKYNGGNQLIARNDTGTITIALDDNNSKKNITKVVMTRSAAGSGTFTASDNATVTNSGTTITWQGTACKTITFTQTGDNVSITNIAITTDVAPTFEKVTPTVTISPTSASVKQGTAGTFTTAATVTPKNFNWTWTATPLTNVTYYTKSEGNADAMGEPGTFKTTAESTTTGNNTLVASFAGNDFFKAVNNVATYTLTINEPVASTPDNTVQTYPYTWNFADGSSTWGTSSTQLPISDWTGEGTYYHTAAGATATGYNIDAIKGLRFQNINWLGLDWGYGHIWSTAGTITIPNVPAGMTIKIVAENRNESNAATTITPTNATYAGEGTATLGDYATHTFTVTASGNVSFMFSGNSSIKSIAVVQTATPHKWNFENSTYWTTTREQLDASYWVASADVAANPDEVMSNVAFSGEELTKDGTNVLPETQGLLMTAVKGSSRFKIGRYYRLGNYSKASITIPSMTTGQTVTFKVETATSGMERGITATSSNLELISGQVSSEISYFTYRVTRDGDGVFRQTSDDAGLKIYYIDLKAATPAASELKFVDASGNDISNTRVSIPSGTSGNLDNYFKLSKSDGTAWNSISVTFNGSIISADNPSSWAGSFTLGNSTGEATITARTENNSTETGIAVLYVSVKNQPTVTLSYTQAPPYLVDYGQDFNGGTSTVKGTSSANLTVKYKSSNERVATVDAAGHVTCVGVGTATITAYTEETTDNLYAEASYDVTYNSGNVIFQFEPSEVKLAYGKNITPYLHYDQKGQLNPESLNFTMSKSGIVTCEIVTDARQADKNVIKITSLDDASKIGETVIVTASAQTKGESPIWYYTTIAVTITAEDAVNFDWVNGDDIYVYENTYFPIPGYTGNANGNNHYSNGPANQSTHHAYYYSISNGSVTWNKENYKLNEGVPDYSIANDTGEALIFWGHSDNNLTGDTLLVYAKSAGTVTLHAKDSQTDAECTPITIHILAKSELDAAHNAELNTISFPYTWDFTKDISDNDFANSMFWEEDNQGRYTNTAAWMNQDWADVLSGITRYSINFMGGIGAGSPMALFKGMQIELGNSTFSSKIARLRVEPTAGDGKAHLYVNGGPHTLTLPRPGYTNPNTGFVEPSNYQVIIKLKTTTNTEVNVNVNGTITTHTSKSDSSPDLDANVDAIISQNVASGQTVKLGIGNAYVYWIAMTTESKTLAKFDNTTYWASTYSYSKDVDLAKSHEAFPNVTAHYASAFSGQNEVTMSEITNQAVPSGTGMLLKATTTDNPGASYFIANAENVSVYSAPSAISGTNYLKANPEVGTKINANTTIDDNQYTNFTLAYRYKVVHAGGGIDSDYTLADDWSFYRIAPSGITVSNKNLAYLQVPGDLYIDAYSSRRAGDATGANPASQELLKIVFDDDNNTGTTDLDISTVTPQTVDNGAWYTLQGVRVSAPTKGGIYIHNGRKVVIK